MAGAVPLTADMVGAVVEEEFVPEAAAAAKFVGCRRLAFISEIGNVLMVIKTQRLSTTIPFALFQEVATAGGAVDPLMSCLFHALGCSMPSWATASSFWGAGPLLSFQTGEGVIYKWREEEEDVKRGREKGSWVKNL